MPAQSDLAALLRSMRPHLHPDEFVFCTTSAPAPFPALCTFQESEGFTLICRRTEAELYGLPYTFPCRLITLTVESSLEAVGFLAAISAELARLSIPVNVISAYHHDHLFVPAEQAENAMQALAGMERAAQL